MPERGGRGRSEGGGGGTETEGEAKRARSEVGQGASPLEQSERRRREAEALLEATLATAAFGICVFDDRGRFARVNPAFCTLFDYRPEELIGRPYAKILPAEELEHAEAMFQTFMTGKQRGSQTGEMRGKRRNGDTLYMEVSSRLLLAEGGRRFQVCSVIDVTERKERTRELEERAMQAHAEAAQKSELLRELDGQLALTRKQHQEILELSAPILDVWAGVLALPIIGSLDAERAQTITERVLQTVSSERARYLLVDLGSANVSDERSFERLIRLCQAVRLLGAEAVLTGISPSAATSLAKLAKQHTESLSELRALATLREGLAYCLEQSKADRRSGTRRL